MTPWRRVALDVPVPMTQVITTGTPQYHRSAAARMADFPMLEAFHAAAIDVESSAVVPLVFEGQATGALGVSFPEERDLGVDERWIDSGVVAGASILGVDVSEAMIRVARKRIDGHGVRFAVADAEGVVQDLFRRDLLRTRRLLYYDSSGDLDELSPAEVFRVDVATGETVVHLEQDDPTTSVQIGRAHV